MQAPKDFFSDISGVLSGAFATVSDQRKAFEQMFHTYCKQFFTGMNLVTREEFEVVREMAQKAREENEKLRAEIETLKQYNHE